MELGFAESAVSCGGRGRLDQCLRMESRSAGTVLADESIGAKISGSRTGGAETESADSTAGAVGGESESTPLPAAVSARTSGVPAESGRPVATESVEIASSAVSLGATSIAVSEGTIGCNDIPAIRASIRSWNLRTARALPE